MGVRRSWWELGASGSRDGGSWGLRWGPGRWGLGRWELGGVTVGQAHRARIRLEKTGLCWAELALGMKRTCRLKTGASKAETPEPPGGGGCHFPSEPHLPQRSAALQQPRPERLKSLFPDQSGGGRTEPRAPRRRLPNTLQPASPPKRTWGFLPQQRAARCPCGGHSLSRCPVPLLGGPLGQGGAGPADSAPPPASSRAERLRAAASTPRCAGTRNQEPLQGAGAGSQPPPRFPSMGLAN